jgi:NADH-quinone oxidoreductase subunit D
MPYTDRLDYICSLTNNWAYAIAVEKLAGLEVPERAQYIRVITAELTRIQNHASAIGFLLQEMGASGTPLMYAFREREKILDLFEELTGSRMMCNYMRFGGCRVELPKGWLDQVSKVVEGLPEFIDETEALLTGNEILMARTQGVGILKPDLAVNAGITGPMLRATGVNYDIRKVDHYGIYDRLRTHRGAQGRTGFLSHQRWERESVSISREAAVVDQPHGARRYVPGPERGGRSPDLWKRGHCAGRGRPMIRPIVNTRRECARC